MNGELAQVVAVVAHGNLFLGGGAETHAPDLLRTNSTFQYVSSVRFTRHRDRDDKTGAEVASDVPAWLRLLRSAGARRLWHVRFEWAQETPEHKFAGFAGAVPLAIQADLPGAFELWYPASKFEKRADAGSSDMGSWAVNYRSLMFRDDHARRGLDRGAVKARLREAVAQAERFARVAGAGAETWAEWFANALRLLDDPAPVAPFYPDMFPAAGYGLEARQLIAAAAQAYVFGGMGSWNDLWLEDEGLQREYERVSAELYEAVKLATVAAPNSFST